jgi:hypothetical protein
MTPLPNAGISGDRAAARQRSRRAEDLDPLLGGLRREITQARSRLEVMTARVDEIPHRARYLRLINDYARRSLDAQDEWLDEVEDVLSGPD